MAPSSLKKRKIDEDHHLKRSKRFRKQEYHSSSSSASVDEADGDDFPAVDLADSESDSDTKSKKKPKTNLTARNSLSTHQSDSASSSPSSDSDSSQTSHSQHANQNPIPKKPTKRNDPHAFAASISSILSSKVPSSSRPDPVLSHSRAAADASASVVSSRLEARALSTLRAQRKQELEKGRVKDVLLGTDAGENIDAGTWVEEEKRLRKTAQRGVVKLFNAVRAAQVRGEEARKEARGVGREREEKVGEMSKKGFLELVAGGGGQAPKVMTKANIEEA